MEHETNRRVVHSYDTERHAVRCGEAEQTNSTKHERSVTCPSCRDLLDERSTPRSSGSAASSGERT